MIDLTITSILIVACYLPAVLLSLGLLYFTKESQLFVTTLIKSIMFATWPFLAVFVYINRAEPFLQWWISTKAGGLTSAFILAFLITFPVAVESFEPDDLRYGIKITAMTFSGLIGLLLILGFAGFGPVANSFIAYDAIDEWGELSTKLVVVGVMLFRFSPYAGFFIFAIMFAIRVQQTVSGESDVTITQAGSMFAGALCCLLVIVIGNTAVPGMFDWNEIIAMVPTAA